MARKNPPPRPTVEPKPDRSIGEKAKTKPSELIQRSQEVFEGLKKSPNVPDKQAENRKKYIRDYKWLNKPGRTHHHHIEFKTKREQEKIGLRDLFSSERIKIRIGSANKGHPARRGKAFFAEKGKDGHYYFMDGKRERIKIYTGDVVVPGWGFNEKMDKEYFALKKTTDKERFSKDRKELINREISKEGLFAYDNLYTDGIAEQIQLFKQFGEIGNKLDNPKTWDYIHGALSIRGGPHFSKKYVDKFKRIFGEYPKAYKSPLVEFVAKLGLSGKQQEFLLSNLLKRRPKFDITKPSNKKLVRKLAVEYRKIAKIPKRKGKSTVEKEPPKIASRKIRRR